MIRENDQMLDNVDADEVSPKLDGQALDDGEAPDERVAPGDREARQASQRVAALLWDPPAPSGRGPRPKLALDEVVTAAIRLADAHGFDALTMRAIARSLGVATMSLYTYLPGKAELFELMIDRAYGGRELPDRDLPWRARYEFHVREALAMYRRHPWMLRANLARLPVGPHVLDVSEDLLHVGLSAGLDAATRARMEELIQAYVYGVASKEHSDQEEARRSGMSVDEFWASRAEFWDTYFDLHRYPTMVNTWESGVYDSDADAEEEATFALAIILDGLERFVANVHQED
ncbi:MAG: TetR/AcrR family transcriptional regulator [Dermatophilaceae bacterium]